SACSRRSQVPRPRSLTARGCAAMRRRLPRNRRSAPARWPISIAGSPTIRCNWPRESQMRLPCHDAALLQARWTDGVLLKRGGFSTVERGHFQGDGGSVDAVLRRLDEVPWWSFLPARHLFAREKKALGLARGLDVGPELLWAGERALVRGFID